MIERNLAYTPHRATTPAYRYSSKDTVSLTAASRLAVKAAESPEGLILGQWVCVDLQGVALQGQDEDAPTLLRVYEFTLLVLVGVILLNEVEAVLHEAQH